MLDSLNGNWSVYAHLNKINGKMYIGITGRKLKERWGLNGSLYRKESQPAFYNAIKKYGWENFDHIEIISGISNELASIIETELILKYHTCVYDDLKNGYNMNYGGELHRTGIKMTEETKHKMSLKQKGENNGFYGKHHTEETKKYLSEINKERNTGENNPFYGKHHTLETRKKLSHCASQRKGSKNPNYNHHSLKGKCGTKHTEETKKHLSEIRRKNKIGYKQTYCFNNDTIYESAKQASQILGLSHSEVVRCCNGKLKSTKGYSFKYV